MEEDQQSLLNLLAQKIASTGRSAYGYVKPYIDENTRQAKLQNDALNKLIKNPLDPEAQKTLSEFSLNTAMGGLKSPKGLL